ncbi:peptidoglycan-binding domain-containing protein [Nonomuraea zeae]|uniref:peptidoglycan-binding domain-containing protein n=1 Tax=Nonomuraea zeae TaxID=1642303 RepID=UPI00360EED84
MREAKRYEGYQEKKTNRTEFGKEFGWDGVAWCQIYQSVIVKRAYKRAGSSTPLADAKELIPWTASCSTAAKWFKTRDRFSQTPKVGSQVFYGPAGSTHVELVIEVGHDYIKTIGGNTAGNFDGRYHEGNGVYTKTINRNSSRIYGYGHPKYTAETNPITAPIYDAPKYPGKLLKLGGKSRFLTKFQKRMAQLGYTIIADGVFGPQTLGVVKAFQQRAGLPSDGVIGPQTWAAAWATK